MGIHIAGTGRALPKNYMTNDNLAEIVDTSDEWIKSRVGIERRYLVKEETTTSMSAEAAEKAIENAGISPLEIELIIVASLTADKAVPSAASQVQELIGAKNAVAFDLNSACSGFVTALNTAAAYFQAGIYKKALIIGAETLSKIIDWNDRGTCVLFGDGAGAAVLEADDNPYLKIVQGTDGSRGRALDREASPIVNPFVKGENIQKGLYMDGQAVFKFAVKIVPECVKKICEQNQIDQDQIKYYIIHQANKRILQTVARRLGEPEEKFPSNVHKYGNTSSASIPILLDEMNREGKLSRGDRIVLCGFGGGLSWAAAALTW